MEHHVWICLSFSKNSRRVIQDWVPVSASRFRSRVIWGRLLSPWIDFWARRRGHSDKEATAAPALRAAVVSGVPQRRNLMVGSRARGLVSWDRVYTVSRVLPWLPDYLGWPREGADGDYGHLSWGAQGVGSGNKSLMNLLTTIMSLRGKGEMKRKERGFFEKLGRQNQGKTHDEKW